MQQAVLLRLDGKSVKSWALGPHQTNTNALQTLAELVALIYQRSTAIINPFIQNPAAVDK